jgi:hypothetical protein
MKSFACRPIKKDLVLFALPDRGEFHLAWAMQAKEDPTRFSGAKKYLVGHWKSIDQ